VKGIAGRVGNQVFDQERHAGERASLRRLGLGTRLLEAAVDHGVQAPIEVLDVGDGGVDELERTHFSLAHELRLTGRVEPGEISRQSHGGGA
jgi:hypothetical protein